jgi:hypothetical protein
MFLLVTAPVTAITVDSGGFVLKLKRFSATHNREICVLTLQEPGLPTKRFGPHRASQDKERATDFTGG